MISKKMLKCFFFNIIFEKPIFVTFLLKKSKKKNVMIFRKKILYGNQFIKFQISNLNFLIIFLQIV